MSSQFQLQRYLQIIENKIKEILQRPAKEDLPFDILDNEIDKQILLISLKIKQK